MHSTQLPSTHTLAGVVALAAAALLLIGCAAQAPATVAPVATQNAPAGAPGDRVYRARREADRAVVAATVPAIAPPTDPQSWVWRLPPGVPEPVVPADNPMTAAKVELGRHLFYDARLSGNGTQACATCHAQALAFTDARRTSTGSTGDAHPRNAQALVNVAYNSALTWANPLLTEVERQVQIPIFGEFPVEMGVTGNEDAVLDRIKADPRYAALFAAAFPGQSDAMSFANIVKALSVFTRALISFDSPYDRYTYGGDASALSAEALRGMALFMSEELECHHCHSGFNFSQSTRHANTTFIEQPFFNTGLYNLDGAGAYPIENRGLLELTNDAADMGKFRPPTLRNIALTAPYMHDGSIDSLESVIDTYARAGRLIESGPLSGDGAKNPHKSGLVPGFTITEAQKREVIAFLNSLTDTGFVTDPRFADPFASAPPETR
jgi:cytochrome c peroxidase